MKVINLDKVDSTNVYAKSNIDMLEDKTLIRAGRQTSGRGRLNRNWVDLGEGNIFVSFVLKPSIKYSDVYSNLTQYLSVCLCRVLESYGVRPQLKWPNDVLVNGGKIAGILAETVMQGEDLKGIVLGIGINLNAKKSDTTAITDKVATALNIEINKSVDADKFLEVLVDEFFNGYDKFLNNGFVDIKDEYIQRNCFINRELNIQILNRTENGIAKEINDSGELVLLNKENKEVVITAGDIL